ncbi:hypothetical protein B0H11DRAFT_2225892 [Mycena galericulata]|nr:hypothetical protein B0H11DRAFT_2225892 [Mycena galericulata]
MANTSPNAPTAPTPEEELAALVAQVAALSKLALDVTRHCIDISDQIPRVVRAQVSAAVAENTPSGPAFLCTVGPSPGRMEALFPPGQGDNQPWYVVCVGHRPGLYASSSDADDQVRGVPNSSRRRKDTRQEALAYYRSQFDAGEVARVTEAPVVPASSPPAASGSRAATQ